MSYQLYLEQAKFKVGPKDLKFYRGPMNSNDGMVVMLKDILLC